MRMVVAIDQYAALSSAAATRNPVEIRAWVMESGEITLEGPARTLLDDPKVRAAYLGEKIADA